MLINKRTVFRRPSGERGKEPILLRISVPCRLPQSFHLALIRSDPVETEDGHAGKRKRLINF